MRPLHALKAVALHGCCSAACSLVYMERGIREAARGRRHRSFILREPTYLTLMSVSFEHMFSVAMKNVACQPPVGQALRSVGCLPAAIISKPVADMQPGKQNTSTSWPQGSNAPAVRTEVRHDAPASDVKIPSFLLWCWCMHVPHGHLSRFSRQQGRD